MPTDQELTQEQQEAQKNAQKDVVESYTERYARGIGPFRADWTFDKLEKEVLEHDKDKRSDTRNLYEKTGIYFSYLVDLRENGIVWTQDQRDVYNKFQEISPKTAFRIEEAYSRHYQEKRAKKLQERQQAAPDITQAVHSSYEQNPAAQVRPSASTRKNTGTRTQGK